MTSSQLTFSPPTWLSLDPASLPTSYWRTALRNTRLDTVCLRSPDYYSVVMFRVRSDQLIFLPIGSGTFWLDPEKTLEGGGLMIKCTIYASVILSLGVTYRHVPDRVDTDGNHGGDQCSLRNSCQNQIKNKLSMNIEQSKHDIWGESCKAKINAENLNYHIVVFYKISCLKL